MEGLNPERWFLLGIEMECAAVLSTGGNAAVNRQALTEIAVRFGCDGRRRNGASAFTEAP